MKNIILTGAANGVGKAVAELLSNKKLILLDIDENNLKDLAERLNSDYYVCDVSDEKQSKFVFRMLDI